MHDAAEDALYDSLGVTRNDSSKEKSPLEPVSQLNYQCFSVASCSTEEFSAGETVACIYNVKPKIARAATSALFTFDIFSVFFVRRYSVV